MVELLKQITLIKDNLEKSISLEQKLKKYEMLEKKIGMSLEEFVNQHYVKPEVEESSLSGQIVSQEVIDEIKTYFRITNHALDRLSQRTRIIVTLDNGSVDYKETIRNIKFRINHRVLAYYNTDDTINIAIDRFNYFVFKKGDDNIWVLVTFKEKSYNNNDIFYKQELAKMGIDRKEV